MIYQEHDKKLVAWFLGCEFKHVDLPYKLWAAIRNTYLDEAIKLYQSMNIKPNL